MKKTSNIWRLVGRRGRRIAYYTFRNELTGSTYSIPVARFWGV